MTITSQVYFINDTQIPVAPNVFYKLSPSNIFEHFDHTTLLLQCHITTLLLCKFEHFCKDYYI